MSQTTAFHALLLAALLPGCAWWGGAEETREPDGPFFVVLIHNSGSHDADVRLEVMEGGRLAHQDAYAVEAGKTVERQVTFGVNGTKLVRVTYAIDAGGRAASGAQENSFDPATCQGTYRITFEIRPDEELTLVGNHGQCDVREG